MLQIWNRTQAGNYCHRTEYRERIKRNEDNIRDPWDNIKHRNICIIKVPRRRREKGTEKIFEEIRAENFPNMEKEIANQVQKA